MSLPVERLRSPRARRAMYVRPPPRRDQADADFDQADVAFHRRDALGRVQRHFAAAAQRHAAHRRDHRHVRVAHRSIDVLQLLLPRRRSRLTPPFMKTGSIACRSAPAEKHARRARPDHQALVLLLG